MHSATVTCGNLLARIEVGRANRSLIDTFESSDAADPSTDSMSAMEGAKKWLLACKADGTHIECHEAYSNGRKRNYLYM
jgi:hypothetical protein